MLPLLRELLSLAIVVGLMGYSYWLGRDRHVHRLRKAEAAIARVRDLHPKHTDRHGSWCGTCHVAWPCDTRAALGAPTPVQIPDIP